MSKAIDELRAAATTENIQNKVAVPLADALRIVGELEAQLERVLEAFTPVISQIKPEFFDAIDDDAHSGRRPYPLKAISLNEARKIIAAIHQRSSNG